MTRDDFSNQLGGRLWRRAWSRSLERASGLRPRALGRGRSPPVNGTQDCLTLQELLASEVTLAVLRADALAMHNFEATLRAAVKRLESPAPCGSRKSKT